MVLNLRRALLIVGLAAGFATPALAIVDDGSGCGCIYPCFPTLPLLVAA